MLFTHNHTRPLPLPPVYSIGHPRESEEWKGMSMDEKFAFFAPIWRVMRDDNISVEEVQRQVEYVALSVKKGTQVSGAWLVGWLFSWLFSWLGG